MSLQVGITGAIGSGKTTVCKIFESLAIPVFYADVEAKKAYDDVAIRQFMTTHFGESIYRNQKIQTKILAKLVFSNPEQLKLLNSIIHPYARKQYQVWIKMQHSAYTLKEAALLIESHAHRELDVLIGVRCDEQTRIKRVLDREQSSIEEVKNRMKNQMTEAEKLQHCHYIIDNNTDSKLIQQILTIHKQIHEKAMQTKNSPT